MINYSFVKYFVFLTTISLLTSCKLFLSLNTNKFYDENGKEISEFKFRRKQKSKESIFVFIKDGDVYHKKHIPTREEAGIINNRELLQSKIEQKLKRKLNPELPLLIYYSYGIDPYNSHLFQDSLYKGSTKDPRKSSIYSYYKIEPILMHRQGDINYGPYHIVDPDGIFEKLFFKEHYPGGSFTVIAKNGEFYTYHGECTFQQVIDAIETLKKVE